MGRKIILFSGLIAVIAAFVTLMVVFGPFGGDVEGLEGVEIREYEGENLSSVNDFRENSIRGPQAVDIETYQLTLDGLVSTPQNLTYADITGGFPSYEKVIRLDCVEGWSVNILWEGVLVKDLLDASGLKPEAKVIIFHAVDGYTTSFPVEYLVDNDIILAHKMNGVTLPEERGFPFQLAAESKWGYKWIKWVTRIEASDNVDYRGFWESRGYSHEADLDDSFFD